MLTRTFYFSSKNKGTAFVFVLRAVVPPGGGGIPFENVEEADRLAQGCKSQILISLRVVGTKRRYTTSYL